MFDVYFKNSPNVSDFLHEIGVTDAEIAAGKFNPLEHRDNINSDALLWLARLDHHDPATINKNELDLYLSEREVNVFWNHPERECLMQLLTNSSADASFVINTIFNDTGTKQQHSSFANRMALPSYGKSRVADSSYENVSSCSPTLLGGLLFVDGHIPEAIQQAGQAVIPVLDESGAQVGSAVVISSEGELATADHVFYENAMADKAKPRFVSVNDKLVPIDVARTIERQAQNDELRVAVPELAGHAFLPVTETLVKNDDQVWTIGYPGPVTEESGPGFYSMTFNTDNTRYYTTGTVLHDSAQFVWSNARVKPGNSGGALVDSNGHFIGLITELARIDTDTAQNPKKLQLMLEQFPSLHTLPDETSLPELVNVKKSGRSDFQYISRTARIELKE